MSGLRSRVFDVIESGARPSLANRLFDTALVLLILSNVAAVCLETVPELDARHQTFFDDFEVVTVAAFTVEYLLRLWVCVESRTAGSRTPLAARLRYLATPLALVDLMAILPFYLEFLIGADLGILRLLRLLRLLKLTRHSPALQTIGVVLRSQSRALTASMVILLIILVFSSAIVYLAEKDVRPGVFSSIPAAMWWSVATLTTVGYGDVTPVTPLGKLFGSITMIVGLGMFALPTGILATGFADEIRKRNFVVTWRLVAAVPLFREVDALRIAEIASLLKPKLVPPRYAVVRRGEPAESMYFIVHGNVEVDVPPTPIRLGPGNYFGEIALMTESTRTATVTAVTECQLLYLDVADFKRLLQANPDLAQQIQATVDARLSELKTQGQTGE